MKTIVCYRDPDNNPSDRAEAIIQSLGNSLTKLHNLHVKYKKMYLEHGSDDAKMSRLSDIAGDLLKEVDLLVDKYRRKSVKSSVMPKGNKRRFRAVPKYGIVANETSSSL